MELRYFGVDELALIEGGAHEIRSRQRYRWRNYAEDAFVVPDLDEAGNVLSWHVYSRPRFLELAGRIRRFDVKVTDDHVERILELLSPSALKVEAGAQPEAPAVVLRDDLLIGAWSEPRRSEWSQLSRGGPIVLDNLRELDAERNVSVWIPATVALTVTSEAPAEALKEPEELFHVFDASAEPEEEPAEADKPVVQETLRRTPHVKVEDDPPLEPGAVVRLTVYTDPAAPLPLERSQDVVIVAPKNITTFDLEVVVTPTDHFEVVGEAIKPLRIERAKKRSKDVRFELRVKPEAASIPGKPAVSVLFHNGRRPAGKVRRLLRVAWPVSGDRDGEEGELKDAPRCDDGVLSIQPLAELADLVVLIWTPSGAPPYQCMVLAEGQTWGPEPWELTNAAEFVKQKMKQFEQKGESPQRVADLKGAGEAFFTAAPRVFRDALRSLVKSGKTPASVFVATEEPFMPWELMVPNWATKEPPHTLKPLGVMCAMGRWIHPCLEPSRQGLKLKDAYVLAAESKKKPLEQAPKEAKFVCESLAAINPKEIDPVSFDELKKVLNEHVASLLHFVCHGAGEGFDSKIYLDDDKPLSADRLRGMASRELWIAAEPIVFLNACEVGRAQPGIAGGTGFARTMIELGARGVIAPLWTVKDTLAREVAEEVYTAALADSNRSVAEILQDLRRRTYEEPEAEDTYAAYCWFGDPATGLQI